MTANEFGDSIAVAALAQANRQAQSAGGEIGLVMDGAAVRRIFKLTRVDRVFRVFDDLPAAVSAPGLASPRDVSSSELSGPRAGRAPERAWLGDLLLDRLGGTTGVNVCFEHRGSVLERLLGYEVCCGPGITAPLVLSPTRPRRRPGPRGR